MGGEVRGNACHSMHRPSRLWWRCLGLRSELAALAWLEWEGSSAAAPGAPLRSVSLEAGLLPAGLQGPLGLRNNGRLILFGLRLSIQRRRRGPSRWFDSAFHGGSSSSSAVTGAEGAQCELVPEERTVLEFVFLFTELPVCPAGSAPGSPSRSDYPLPHLGALANSRDRRGAGVVAASHQSSWFVSYPRVFGG